MQSVKSMLLHSKTINKVNPILALVIKLYLVETYPKESVRQKIFLKEIESERIKFNIPENKKTNEILTYEEFSQFLSKLLESVIKEEKTGQVTFNTAACFRLIADLIEMVNLWRPLEVEEEWLNISNF
jgi:hypothetical protein